MEFQEIIEAVGKAIDAIGVFAIVAGVLFTTGSALRDLSQRRSDTYSRFRRLLGRSILLGLELLVAADIIRTVAVTPTFQSISVLAGIVVIRTFLSWSLELEISGRWPWQKKTATHAASVEPGKTAGRQQSDGADTSHHSTKPESSTR